MHISSPVTSSSLESWLHTEKLSHIGFAVGLRIPAIRLKTKQKKIINKKQFQVKVNI